MCAYLTSFGAGSGCPLPTMVTTVLSLVYSPTDGDDDDDDDDDGDEDE